jgi:ABC-type nitrate/sulfonate/bicarbonate transport system permease component
MRIQGSGKMKPPVVFSWDYIMRFYYKKAIGFISIISVLILWTLIVKFKIVPSKFLSSPAEICSEFVKLAKDGYMGTPLFNHFWASFVRTSTGFALGCTLAIPIGLLIGYYKYLSSAVTPIMAFLRPIPAIALIPLFILWFGIGESAKVALIFYSSFLYISINTTSGVRNISLNLIRAAQSLGARKWQIFLKVIIPESLPSIITGVRIGAIISWAVVVASELIAAQAGLGYMIMDAATFFRINAVYVGILLIGMIGIAIENIIGFLEYKLIHWSGKT